MWYFFLQKTECIENKNPFLVSEKNKLMNSFVEPIEQTFFAPPTIIMNSSLNIFCSANQWTSYWFNAIAMAIEKKSLPFKTKSSFIKKYE